MSADIANVFDFERIARQKVDEAAWGYYASGANDEITLRRNREAFDRREIHYRVLADVSDRNLGTRVLGTDISMPMMVAPTAFHRLAHEDGEIATVRAAGGAGTVMMLSTLSNTNVEDVVGAATGPVWFQLYVYKDRSITEKLVQRVAHAGCSALVLTVDAPVLGKRERDVRNRFSLPDGLSIENMLPAGLHELPPGPKDSGLAAYFASLIDPSLTWSDIDWLRRLTDLPLVIKGIVRPDDAKRAHDCGADAIVVSNHGGRQLDTAPPTLDVLESIVDTVYGLEVYLDGGIRRGTDVLKALALGARAVLVGRPILWGLATDGEDGARAVLELLRDELDTAMALAGCRWATGLPRDLVVP